jgi:hypothetical protein
MDEFPSQVITRIECESCESRYDEQLDRADTKLDHTIFVDVSFGLLT